MNEKDAIRAILGMKRMSQLDLAEAVGYPSQSHVSGLLNRNKNGIRCDKLCQLLEGLDCDLIIRDRQTKTEFLVEQDKDKEEEE